ncbi:MAG: PLP-dependent aminotransferase family protein [Actinomycetota bacterium]
MPAYDHFPMRVWRTLSNQYWRQPTSDLLGYGTPHGYRPLRVAIAEHLNSVRGVNCEPDQVIIVSGSQQALDLAFRVLLDPDDEVWIENPAYPGARSALVAAGARLVPVPVDSDGLDVSVGLRESPNARMAYVTPSHQYPLGATMSVARRMQLLRWADQRDAWIIEDDYDSEFRYSGRLLPTLQGLDTTGRTIYVGTFSKVMFPSLRLGYVVVPTELVDGFLAARAVTDRHPPTVEQAVLAEFISAGHFLRHVRRMRKLYAQRQVALLTALDDTCGDLLTVGPDDAGMHLIGWLPEGVSDSLLAARSAERGVSTPPLSHYYNRGDAARAGVILGYTGFDEAQLRSAARHFSEALRSCL